jgi:hypothetical protein
MLTAVLKAVKMLLSCCPNKNSQDAVVLTALKAVQDAEKKSPPQRPSTKTYSHQLESSEVVPKYEIYILYTEASGDTV